MNPKRIASFLLILFMAVAMVFSFIPIVHAASPSVTNLQTGTCTNFTPAACGAGVSVTQGDIIVAGFTVLNTPGVGMQTPTDSAGNLYAAANEADIVNSGNGCLSSGGAYTCTSVLFVATASTTATITISTGMSGTSCGLGGCAYEYEFIDVTNAGGSVVCTAANTNTAGTVINTGLNLCNASSSQTSIAQVSGAASGTMSAGASFTAYCYSTCGAPASGSMIMYAVVALSGTQFPATNGASSTWAEAAIILGTASASTQTQTIGSCTATATGGTYLANSTQYWYAGNALGQEAVSTIKTQVENIKGSGSHTLQLLIYVTAANPGAQTPSVFYPAILAYSQSFVITSGTTNSTITLNVNIPLNTANISPLPFNFWSVGIVGDDHIRIHNSALSGMTTQTGAASTASQPSQFTGPGSTTTTKLQVCATGNYQSVISGPTTTTTAAASTTLIVSTTSTATISTISANLFASSSNWPVIFLILLLPAGLFMGISRSLTGLLAGLMVGAIMGILMGIIPNYVFVGLVIAIVAIAFLSRGRD